MRKNPYGIRDGHLVTVDEVDRGLACNCTCPNCGARLEARKGAVKVQHFAHASGSDCGYAVETALHIMAKEILAAEKRIRLPELIAQPLPKDYIIGSILLRKEVIPRGYIQELDTVSLEKKIGGVVPDVLCEAKGRQLMVEIYVTHAVDEVKLAKVRELGIATVEFDFSKANRLISRKDLRDVLVWKFGLWGYGRSKWLYHPHHAAAVEEVTREYLEKHKPKPPPPPPPPPATQRRLFEWV